METDQEQEQKEHEFIESYNTLIKKCNLVPIVGELFRNKKVYFSENVLKTVYSYDLIRVSMLSKDAIGEQERLIDEMNKEQEFYKLAQEWGVADVVPKVMEEQGEEEGEIATAYGYGKKIGFSSNDNSFRGYEDGEKKQT
jgi:hypothetical protein